MEMFVTPQRLLKALSFATCSLNSEHLVDALVTRLAVRRVERDDAGVCAAAVIKCARASKVHGDDPNLRRKNFLNERFETRVAADIIKHFIDSSAKKSYSFIPLLCQPHTTQQISKPRIQAQIVHLGANSQQRKFVIALLISFFEPGERFVLL